MVYTVRVIMQIGYRTDYRSSTTRTRKEKLEGKYRVAHMAALT
jgi:hypothetical protein